MRRHALSALLATLALVSTANTAPACMWDSEVVGHEKQFKSSYIEQPGSTSLSHPSLAQRAGSAVGVLGAAGVAMVVGAMAVGLVRQRKSGGTAS